MDRVLSRGHGRGPNVFAWARSSPDKFGRQIEAALCCRGSEGPPKSGQLVAGTDLLTPTGPIAEGAGVLMIIMAGIVAYRARAPLVCRLPLPGTLQCSTRLGILGPFVSGFAIATGCLACFGGAILGVLLVYRSGDCNAHRAGQHATGAGPDRLDAQHK
jgi:hypothetical protein